MDNDVDIIVVNKKAMPMCSAVCEFMSERNMVDVGVQFHELHPLVVTQEARRSVYLLGANQPQMLCRCWGMVI
jgi:hypothetical protein